MGASGALMAAGMVMKEQEARRQQKEVRRTTREQMARETEDLKSNISSNIASLAASGLSLEGSPMFLLESNIKTGFQNIYDIGRAGLAKESQIGAAARQQIITGLAQSGAGGTTGAGAQ